MFRQYRPIEEGEFFLIGGDCSQGGEDYNACYFMSRNKLDFPLVYHSRGVAATMTSTVHPVIESIFDVTGIPPIVAFETNNGGASEMERLSVLNRSNKYKLYMAKSVGSVDSGDTKRYGYVTNSATRPILLGQWKEAIDNHLVKMYDKPTIKEHLSFIVNERGKPEAETSAHDDLVIAPAICWQMYQTESPPAPRSEIHRVSTQNQQNIRRWSIG